MISLTIILAIMSIFNFGTRINIDPETFDSLRNDGYIVIDVRTPTEYSEAHIENSILIDIYSPTFKEEIDKLDKSQKYLIYCRSGNRSLYAAKYMESIGFSEVLNLDEGIISWIKSGKPVIKN